MRAGRLRHRLSLQQQTQVQDAYGGFTTTWTTVATVWGAIEALRGKESFEVGQTNSEVTARVVIRYGDLWAGLDNTWRVTDAHSGVKYDIESVIQPEERSRPNTVFELMVKRGETDDE